MTAEFNNDAPIPPEINKYLAILIKDPGSMVFAPLAEAYRKAGILDEAIAVAQDGLKLHPNYVSGMVALGRAYFDKGMHAEAKEALDKVLVIAPDNIIASNVLQEIRRQSVVSSQQSEIKGQWPEVGEQAEAEVKAEESTEEVAPVFEVVEESEPEVIEAAELEELEEVAEAEEVETGAKAEQAYGEEITEELWTGETISEEVKVEEQEEEVRPKKEITTSTIAELYIKQGYLDKAIDIYQTLYNANPYNEEIKRKLDELKKQVEVKAEKQVEVKEEVDEFGVGWAEPTSQESEVPLTPTRSPEGRGGKVEAPPVDENIKRLESWLRTIQSERR